MTWIQVMDGKCQLFRTVDGVVEFFPQCVNDASDKDRHDTFKHAVIHNSLAMVQSLLAAGANPSAECGGDNVLTLAISAGHTDIARELVHAGADIRMRNKAGMTPMQCAAKGKHREIVALLLARTKELKEKSSRESQNQ
jgi:ankyrin repeat protein